MPVRVVRVSRIVACSMQLTVNKPSPAAFRTCFRPPEIFFVNRFSSDTSFSILYDVTKVLGSPTPSSKKDESS